MKIDRRVVISGLVLYLYLFAADASAQLTRQWVARFSGSAKGGSSVATAMAVDDSGNVYVTGWVTRPTTGIDMATIKYSSDGEQLWVKYYTGPSNGEDRARAIAIDTAHNVYVTGPSNGGSSGLDYVTIKYKADGSDTLWTRRYNGPGNGEDVAVAVAVNDSLNVYVTGWSMGSGTGFDYATIKYNAAGLTQWEKRYNGPSGTKTDSALAMVLKDIAAVYVTGASVDSGYDYATIKYAAGSGDSLWVARYNGAGFGNDIARAIILVGSSRIFVTGGSQNGNGDYDYTTIRYDGTTGDTVWTARYNGTANGDDQATAIAVRGTSGVLVTGKSLTAGKFNDIVTIRYAQGGGSVDWIADYNGPANDDDGGVAILGGGSSYVLGYSTGDGVGLDYVLIQYDGSGNENFDVRYNGPANAEDVPHALASFGGAVYVTGTSRSSDKKTDFLTIKYVDPQHVKYRTFSQESLAVKAANIKSGSNPNAGNIRDEAMRQAYPKIKKGFRGAPGGMVVGNVRPDSALMYGWMRFTNGKAVASYLPDIGHARGFDFYGTNPFVGEKKDPKRDKHDNHLVGQLVTLRINIGASDAEITPPTLGDITYNDGDTSNHYNGMTLRQIASLVDNYLTYWKRYPLTNWALFDSILTRTNRAFSGPTGRLPWVSLNPLVVTGAVLIDSVSYVHPATSPLLYPLSFPPASIDNSETPEKYVLHQNYPNPFNPTTNIQFDLPEDAFVTLTVYNMLGQEVTTLLNRAQMSGGTQEVEFNASNLASGIYLYRIVAEQINDDGEVGNTFQTVKKMMLVK